MFQELNLLPPSGEGLSLERQFLFIFYYFSSFALTGIRTGDLFVRQFIDCVLVRNADH